MNGLPSERTRSGAEVHLRPARPDDMEPCARLQVLALDDYIVATGRPVTSGPLDGIVTLFRHLLATDPGRWLVAERTADGTLAGFASAWVRGGVWFLALLFVDPAVQGAGVGRRLLEAVLPTEVDRGPDGAPLIRAVATDSAQPISNALYSGYGIVPRVPSLRLAGRIVNPHAFPPLRDGVTATPFAEIAVGPPDGPGHRLLVEATGQIDRELLGYEHPADHRFLRLDGRHGILLQDAAGAHLGYGYVRGDGRLGPIAVRDSALVPALLGGLVSSVAEPDDGFAAWVPGTMDGAVVTLLRAGMRLDDLPVLLCWDRPFVDLSRYLPISNALL